MSRLSRLHALLYALSVLLATTPRAAAAVPVSDGEWHPELAPSGPVVTVVSLDEQRIHVYRNGIAIGVAPISSGRRGYETPQGVYTILEKDRDHRSSLYDDAPMPFMERLTWDGVALHGGVLPGHPASHGCIRLPVAFAEQLFAITQRGDTVIVAGSPGSPLNLLHPGALAPIGSLGSDGANASTESMTWDESVSPEGPVSILVSVSDRAAYVMRNGKQIGTAPLIVDEGFDVPGTLLLVVGEGFVATPSTLDPARPRHRWSAYTVRSHGTLPSLEALASHLRVADPFARALYAVLVPGTTIVVTDASAGRGGIPETAAPILESVIR